MCENYKELKGYRETYLIGEDGSITRKERMGTRRNYVNSYVLTQFENSNGYLRVTLNLNGKAKQYLVHRLVAKAFIPNPDNKPDVNHKDGNKYNNKVSNLEWVTKSENEIHKHRELGKKNKPLYGEKSHLSKLTQEQVNWIRIHHKPFDKEYGTKPLAIKFGVKPQTITELIHKRTWIESLPYMNEFLG